MLGIEEPELYLHPHAQRSLMAQFEQIVAAGNQLFISSHSATFLDIARSDRIVLVERCEDDEESVCTQIHTTTPEALVKVRQALHPNKAMTPESVQAFLGNVRTMEMAEAFFARLVVIVEGPSEREALPLLCANLKLNFDQDGISIVSAGGKTVIDTLLHLYQAHGIKTYVIFDNDKRKEPAKRAYNKVICRALGAAETDLPAPVVMDAYAVLDGDWEEQVETQLELVQPGLYRALVAEACETFLIEPKRNKPLVARYVAEQLAAKNVIPKFILEIAEKLGVALGLLPPTTMPPTGSGPVDDLNDEIPW